MADIKYEIVEELGVLSESAKGWQKELNLISWNGVPHYKIYNKSKTGRNYKKYKRKLDRDGKRHNDRTDNYERRTQKQSQQHIHARLRSVDIGSHSCDKGMASHPVYLRI